MLKDMVQCYNWAKKQQFVVMIYFSFAYLCGNYQIYQISVYKIQQNNDEDGCCAIKLNVNRNVMQLSRNFSKIPFIYNEYLTNMQNMCIKITNIFQVRSV